MSNMFEHAQQLFTDEINYWVEQARTYTEVMAKEVETNVKLVREMAERNQATMERLVRKSEDVRKDFENRSTSLINKLTELKAA